MKVKLLSAIALAGCLCMGSSADLASFSGSIGYMNVFTINGTSDGPDAYQFGGFWGVPDLKTLTGDNLTYQLFPNTNTYDDNPGDAYWRNNGGLGPDGNKWLEATTLREYVLGAGETAASLDFNVSAFTLDGRYNLTAFIKTLDLGAGYGVSAIDSIAINGTSGTTSLSIAGLTPGHILQIGFQMDGINANGATDWGSATATLENVNVIPEPATFGLLGLAGAAVYVTRKIRV